MVGFELGKEIEEDVYYKLKGCNPHMLHWIKCPQRSQHICQPQLGVDRTSSAFDAGYSHKTRRFTQLHEQNHCIRAACEILVK